MVRKHKGIQQNGKNAGRLRKGYYYTGKKTKRGLACIAKTKQKTLKHIGGVTDVRKGQLSRTVAANWNAKCHAKKRTCERNVEIENTLCEKKFSECLNEKLVRLHPIIRS